MARGTMALVAMAVTIVTGGTMAMAAMTHVHGGGHDDTRGHGHGLPMAMVVDGSHARS